MASSTIKRDISTKSKTITFEGVNVTSKSFNLPYSAVWYGTISTMAYTNGVNLNHNVYFFKANVPQNEISITKPLGEQGQLSGVFTIESATISGNTVTLNFDTNHSFMGCIEMSVAD